jgi:hypothetical protein
VIMINLLAGSWCFLRALRMAWQGNVRIPRE